MTRPAQTCRARIGCTLSLSLAAVTVMVTMGGSLALGLLVMPSTAAAQQRIISLDAEVLTRELARRFPQRRCIAGIACVTLSQPKVRMRSDSPRLYVEAVGEPNLGAQSLPEGVIELGAKPRFDAASGNFYLDAPVLTRFSFPGVAQESVATVAGLLQPLVADMLGGTPVWALDENDPQQALARLLLRDVLVREGRLQLVLGDNEPAPD